MSLKPKTAKKNKSSPKSRAKAISHIEKSGALVYGLSIGGALVIGVLVGLALIGPEGDETPTAEDMAIRSYDRASVPIQYPEKATIADPAPVETTPVIDDLKNKAPIVATQVDTSPIMVIVIDDMGLNMKVTDRFVRINTPLTFAFLPYAKHLGLQTRSVLRYGHELIVHMPMEPETWGQNPGPNALLRDMEPAELRKRLQWNLTRFEGFTGINNHMGSRFTQSDDLMRIVLTSVKERGLYFLDSRTSPQSVAYETARKMGIPAMSRDVFLDNDRNVDKITVQLNKARQIAETRGWSISIGHPYPETLEALQAWLPQGKAEGIRFVHLSKLMYDSPFSPEKTAGDFKAPAVLEFNSTAIGDE